MVMTFRGEPFTTRQVPCQPETKGVIRYIRTIREWDCDCFNLFARARHGKRRFNGINMKASATQAWNLCERIRKRCRAVEVSVVFDRIIVMERCEGEVEIEKDFMDTTFGVDEIELPSVVENGFHHQVAVGREANRGGVFSTNQLKPRSVAAVGLPKLHPERRLNFRTSTAALYSSGIRPISVGSYKDGRQEDRNQENGLHRRDCW